MKRNVEEVEEEEDEEEGEAKAAEEKDTSRERRHLPFVLFVFQLECGSHVNSHAHTRYRISIIFFCILQKRRRVSYKGGEFNQGRS